MKAKNVKLHHVRLNSYKKLGRSQEMGDGSQDLGVRRWDAGDRK
nr:hypothetical protein [Okeania sp. SIO2F4]